MPTYKITAEAEGKAEVIVQASDEDAAESLAYREHLTGIRIAGGEAGWQIVTIEEVAA